MPKDKLPVFRKVDGELVRISDDTRDPNRRYHAVASEDGGYHVEFTDEEEKERDEEEARWEAERPQREAEAKRQIEDSERFRESLIYENRIVAFLDILGWKDAITSSISDPKVTQQLGIALQGLVTHVDSLDKQREMFGTTAIHGNPQITHFSDCVVLSVTPELGGFLTFDLHLRAIVNGIMLSGYLVRGGVTEGLLIHKENIVYGPALLRAYELEQHSSRFPRILLDKPLAVSVGEGMPVYTKDGRILGHVSSWKSDTTDGEKYFNFLVNMPVFPDMEPHDGWLLYLRDLVRKGLQVNVNDPNVHQKYVWVAERFNELLKEYPGLGIDHLTVF